MKRIFSLFLALMLVLPCLPGRAAALSGDCGDDLQWHFSEGTLTISGTGDMFSDTYQDAPWCQGQMDVRTLVLEEGVTSIGSFAFRECEQLETVVLPDSLESVEQGAFSGCKSLKSVQIKDLRAWMEVEFATWYEEVFDTDLNAWKEVELCANPLSCNDDVTLWVNGEEATTVTLPEGLTAVGSNSFRDYKKLDVLNVPVSVKAFGDYAFSGCTGLTAVYFPGTSMQMASIDYGTGNIPLLRAQWHYGEGPHTHDYGAWEVVQVPGPDGPGEERRYCDGCDHYESREIPAKEAAIVTQPVDVTVGEGEKAVVSFTAQGDGLTYTWYYKNHGKSKFSKTTSFTGNTYEVAMNDDRNGRQVYCIVTDVYGNTARTDTVTLSLKAPDPVKILSQPTSVWVEEGEKAVVTVEAKGDGLTYKWYYKNPGSSKYTYTSSFKGNTYSIAMSKARSGRYVYCKITDAYGNTVKSKAVSLNMNKTQLEIVTQPKSVRVAEGATARVTVEAQGDGLTYKWYYKNPGSSKYTYTASFTGNSYAITMNDSRDGRYVYCKVYDKYGNMVKTNTVSLRMK